MTEEIAPAQVAQQMFDAYVSGDLETARTLLDPSVTFTSPQDDHIDKDTYLEVCFPTASRLNWQVLTEVVPDGGNGVFVRYQYELQSGDRHRNVEHIRVVDGRIVEIDVYFGGPVRIDETVGADA